MDKVTRQCPQTTTFLKRKESRSGIEPRSFRLPAYRLTGRPNRLTFRFYFTSGLLNVTSSSLRFHVESTVRLLLQQTGTRKYCFKCWRSSSNNVCHHFHPVLFICSCRQCPLSAPSVRCPLMVWECVCVCVCVDGMNLKYALRWHIHISVHSVL